MSAPLDARRVLRLWWPLAASWMLMGLELPMVTAVIARMADPEVGLAAYGSLVLPISLVVEAPIIMLLAASTALATDREAWRKLRRFTLVAGGVLTAVHAAIAFTPLFDLIARRVIGVPEEVIEPARIGLRFMTPWTFSIAWRRFQQGVLIRMEHSRSVSAGTLVRLLANGSVLCLGFLHGGFSGIAVGTAGVAMGVVCEALFVEFRARPLARELAAPAPGAAPLTRASFLAFYVPLAMTPLMTLLVQPIGAASMSRMPDTLSSLAAWPAVHGLVFLIRGVGLAFNEVVVRLMGEPDGVRVLQRTARSAALAMMGLLLLLALTPLGELWFVTISGLPDDLARMSRRALLLAALMPGYAVLQSWYQGALVHARKTRAVPEAVALYLIVSSTLLALGVAFWDGPGIYYTIPSLTIAGVTQTVWLWWRSRAPIAAAGAAAGAVAGAATALPGP